MNEPDALHRATRARGPDSPEHTIAPHRSAVARHPRPGDYPTRHWNPSVYREPKQMQTCYETETVGNVFVVSVLDSRMDFRFANPLPGASLDARPETCTMLCFSRCLSNALASAGARGRYRTFVVA